MNDRLQSGMREASRLTRAGRLTEATALLQRVLHSGKDPYSASGSADVPPTIDLVADTVEETGAGPSLRSGQEFGASARSVVETGVRAYLPEVLRHSFDRITRTGLERGRGGLAEPSPADTLDAPKGGKFLAKFYSNATGSRAYKLYVPSRYRGQPLPLIIMLHGCTQSPDDFAAGTRMNLNAEDHNCFVAYPAQAASANPSKCWNWFRPGDQERGQGEPSLIAGITGQVMSDYSIDAERVYAAGFSAGAAAAVILAATYPDLYAAIGVHSGLACGAANDVPSAFAAMRQSQPAARHRSGRPSPRGVVSRTVPAIVFHGDHDTTVHPHNGDQVVAQLREASNTDLRVTVQLGRVRGGRAYSRTLYHEASGQVIFEQWLIHEAGHTWSGGSPVGSYTDAQGPDAAQEMLRFFLDHPMSF
jgi:poly(hydroxyalkanoate) depolymerase family esterase